jgi:hypothetical protein
VNHHAWLVLWDRVSLTLTPRLASNRDSTISASLVAGIADMSHGTWPRPDFLRLVMCVSPYLRRLKQHNYFHFLGLDMFSLLGTWYLQRCFSQDRSLRWCVFHQTLSSRSLLLNLLRHMLDKHSTIWVMSLVLLFLSLRHSLTTFVWATLTLQILLTSPPE